MLVRALAKGGDPDAKKEEAHRAERDAAIMRRLGIDELSLSKLKRAAEGLDLDEAVRIVERRALDEKKTTREIIDDMYRQRQ